MSEWNIIVWGFFKEEILKLFTLHWRQYKLTGDCKGKFNCHIKFGAAQVCVRQLNNGHCAFTMTESNSSWLSFFFSKSRSSAHISHRDQLFTHTHSLSSPALFGVIDPITLSLLLRHSLALSALHTAQLTLYPPQTLTEAESGPKLLPTFPRTTFCAAHELFIPTIQKKHSGNTWTLTLPSYITFCCTWVTPLHSSYFISGLTPIFPVFFFFKSTNKSLIFLLLNYSE